MVAPISKDVEKANINRGHQFMMVSPQLKHETQKEKKVAKSTDNCIADEEGWKHKLREQSIEGGPLIRFRGVPFMENFQ